jgi:hypothetical protein
MSQHHPAEHQEIERSAFNAAFYELGLRWHNPVNVHAFAVTCKPSSPTCCAPTTRSS